LYHELLLRRTGRTDGRAQLSNTEWGNEVQGGLV